ncbi:hypothetical protein D623_10024729 [Myotis brandtii]|uniref:Uncharacterized protein n=1 Tax=Myotis brandtii TaxID=109478 RepID=S7NCY8_MYOBR|nr:hypothetical protein D623_10024729 [Myotis brandtii]
MGKVNGEKNTPRSDSFNGRNEKGTMGPLSPQTTLQAAAGKGGKPKRTCWFCGTPSSLGHPAGTGDPPSWNQPTSPGKLSFEFRMRKGVLYVSNEETGVQQRIRYKAPSAL